MSTRAATAAAELNESSQELERATMARERPELDWASMAKTVEANAGL